MTFEVETDLRGRGEMGQAAALFAREVLLEAGTARQRICNWARPQVRANLERAKRGNARRGKGERSE